VRATDRLTEAEARDLANQSVWRCFRVIDQDVSGRGPIIVPGYGPLKRRQQLILQDTMVEQVQPQPGDQQLLDQRLQPVTADLYDGYSRDRPARVYGSVYLDLLRHQVLRPADAGTALNSDPTSIVYINFTVDPLQQIITFNKHVYQFSSDDGLEGYV